MIGRRLAKLAVLALAITAGASGVAVADEPIVATIYPAPASGPTIESQLSALEATCTPLYTGPALELFGAGGAAEPESSIPTEAWTVGTVIGCMTSIPLSSVTAVTIDGPDGPEDGTDSLLTQNDLELPSTQAAPVLFADGDGIGYERPWRGGTDDNAADAFQLTAPDPFNLQIFTGPLLTVDVTAPAAAAAGVAVPLAVGGTAGQAGVTYDWSFDGGTGDGTAADPTVTFAGPGTYMVAVQVTDAGGGVGVASATITVGAATSTTGAGPATGPVTSTGTTPGAAPSRPAKPRHRRRRHHARSRAAATPQSPATTRTTLPPATTTRTATTATRTATTSPPAPTTPRPTTTPRATTTAPAPRTTTRASAHAVPIRPPPRSAQTAAPRTTTRPRPRLRVTPRSTSASPPAALVEGRLLSGISPVAPEDSPLVHLLPAASVSAPPVRRLVGGTSLAAAGGGLAVALLLLCGAMRELRWRRLRSAP